MRAIATFMASRPMAIGVLCSTALLTMPAPALADSGSGRFSRYDGSVLRAAKALPLDRLGEDVIRFSSTPALGGRGYVIEVHNYNAKYARGRFQLFIGHPEGRWVETLSLLIEMNSTDFEVLAAAVDAQLAKGEPDQIDENGELFVCMDGPGFVTERRAKGQARWLSGFCGVQHPNEEIADLMSDVAFNAFRKWLPRFAAAPSDEVADSSNEAE